MPNVPGYGHRNLRKGRISILGQAYLVTTTTAKRERLFAEFALAQAAARILGSRHAAATVLCWVLMPDHLHALIELNEGSLSLAVGGLKARMAAAVNRMRRTRTAVWAPAFHDRALRHGDDLLDVARYVIANPVRAGIVRSVREYSFWDAVWLDPPA